MKVYLNLMEPEFPVPSDSQASSSHETSLETMRRVVSGNHSIYTHFPTDEKFEIFQRTRITRAPCRRRIDGVVPRAEFFGDLITADDKILSDGTESRHCHRYSIVVQDLLATQWFQSYPCKTKTSQETERSLQKFLEPSRKPKVIFTDNSLEFGKACEDQCGIIARQPLTVQKQMGLLRCCCNWDWANIGGRIPRNVTAICEIFRTDCLIGKHHTKGDLVNHLKGPSFRLVHWLNIIPCRLKTNQSRILQFGKKVLPGIFLGYGLCAGESGRGYILVVDLQELEEMDASEIHANRLNAKRGDTAQEW